MLTPILAPIRKRFHPLWRLRQWKWFRRLQGWIDFPIIASSGRIKFSLLWLRDSSIFFASELAEPRTTHCFERVLKDFQPGYFLDVGANLGIYSWRVTNQAPKTEIWLFEPDEKNIRLLRRTILKNELKQVTLFPVAVSDQDGSAEFLVDDVSGAAGSIRDYTVDPWTLQSAYGLKIRRQVSCINLDSLREKLSGRRVLVKIDVEGAEEKVLAGAREILREIRPVLFIESFEPKKWAWLSDLNYRLFDLQEGCNWVACPGELGERAEKDWLGGCA